MPKLARESVYLKTAGESEGFSLVVQVNVDSDGCFYITPFNTKGLTYSWVAKNDSRAAGLAAAYQSRRSATHKTKELALAAFKASAEAILSTSVVCENVIAYKLNLGSCSLGIEGGLYTRTTKTVGPHVEVDYKRQRVKHDEEFTFCDKAEKLPEGYLELDCPNFASERVRYSSQIADDAIVIPLTPESYAGICRLISALQQLSQAAKCFQDPAQLEALSQLALPMPTALLEVQHA